MNDATILRCREGVSVDYINRIAALYPCADARVWLREEQHPTLAAAWAACPRGDWMLWLAGKFAGPPGSDARRPLVLAACDCARLALPRWESRYPADLRPRRAIGIAEAWARGRLSAPTLADVQAAASAASASADAAYAACAYGAAAAAATSASASVYAYASASASAATAYAAYAVYADADDARAATLAECADIVRRHYPEPPDLGGGKE